LIDYYRKNIGIRDPISSSRSSRNSNKVFRKYNKKFEYLISYDKKKKYLKKINIVENNIFNLYLKSEFKKLKEKIINKKKKIILETNIYKQLNIFNKKITKPLKLSNRLFKFHYNMINRKVYITKKFDNKLAGYDSVRKLKMMSTLYKKNYYNTVQQDLKTQQNVSKLNRWGIELGRGGFDWFWLKVSKFGNVDKKNKIREIIEKKRFNNSWVGENLNILRKYLKYLTINQYTLKLIRSKYFGTQLSSPYINSGSGNNLVDLRKIFIKNYYPIGQTGSIKNISKNKQNFNF
jgi:hypothetical protein